MKLRPYFAALTLIERIAFSTRVGSTRGHLQNVAYGYRPCAPALANAIEKDTRGVVSRRELCPDDYHLIWPDLTPASGTANVSDEALIERTAEKVVARINEKLASKPIATSEPAWDGITLRRKCDQPAVDDKKGA